MKEAVCPNTDPRSSAFRPSNNSLARCPTASFCPFLLPARIAALLEPGRQESFIMHHLERSDWLSRKRLRPKPLFLEVAPGSRPSPYIVLDNNVLLALAPAPRTQPSTMFDSERPPASSTDLASSSSPPQPPSEISVATTPPPSPAPLPAPAGSHFRSPTLAPDDKSLSSRPRDGPVKAGEKQPPPEDVGARPPHCAFSPHQKTFIIATAASAAFFSPLSSNIFVPAVRLLPLCLLLL